MASILERIPHDVLAHIAFFSASSSVFEPPTAVLQLSLTSRTISASLSRQHCPQLYSRIFCSKFDLAAVRRRARSGIWPSSCLSAELVQRCRLLQHIRRGDMSSTEAGQDLFTAYMMILESDGLNEIQLLVAGFSQFIADFVRNRCATLSNEIRTLALWLFWLTLSRQAILSQSINERNEILLMLRPFAISGDRSPATSLPSLVQTEADIAPHPGTETNCLVMYYAQPMRLPKPNLSSASILLTCVLNEAQPLQVPRHLPPTRAIADASHRAGPTMEDYSVAASYRTLLPADTCVSVPQTGKVITSPTQSLLHDQDFCRMFGDLNPSTFMLCFDISPYTSGMLDGLWEGHYMVSPSVSPSLSPREWPDFLLRHPLQCCLREQMCFSPSAHLPNGLRCVTGNEGDIIHWRIDPHDDTQSEEFEFLNSSSPRESRSESDFLPSSSSPSGHDGDHMYKDTREALGITVIGETSPEHGQAWGAYHFSGRVRLRDGLVILMRKPSFGDDSMGTWIFEGYIHAGGGFVGRWYTSGATEQHGVEGIFSLRKTHDPRQK